MIQTHRIPNTVALLFTTPALFPFSLPVLLSLPPLPPSLSTGESTCAWRPRHQAHLSPSAHI